MAEPRVYPAEIRGRSIAEGPPSSPAAEAASRHGALKGFFEIARHLNFPAPTPPRSHRSSVRLRAILATSLSLLASPLAAQASWSDYRDATIDSVLQSG